MNRYAAGLTLVLAGSFWAGCSSEKSKEEQSIASLPELAPADVAMLKAVPNNSMLATSVLKRGSRPEPASKIQPACAAEDVTITYSVEVEFPVTVCTLHGLPTSGIPVGGIFTQLKEPTHKLDSAKLPQELQSVAGNKSSSGPSQAIPIFQCRQDEGPWQASLTSERHCTNVCSPDNLLTLLNTPNLIEFEWYGSITDDKPPDFTYVPHTLQQLDIDRQSCGHDPSNPKQ